MSAMIITKFFFGTVDITSSNYWYIISIFTSSVVTVGIYTYVICKLVGLQLNIILIILSFTGKYSLTNYTIHLLWWPHFCIFSQTSYHIPTSWSPLIFYVPSIIYCLSCYLFWWPVVHFTWDAWLKTFPSSVIHFTLFGLDPNRTDFQLNYMVKYSHYCFQFYIIFMGQ